MKPTRKYPMALRGGIASLLKNLHFSNGTKNQLTFMILLFSKEQKRSSRKSMILKTLIFFAFSVIPSRLTIFLQLATLQEARPQQGF
jgi:hypothetical protein